MSKTIGQLLDESLREIVEGLGEVMAQECEGYTPTSKLGKEWASRITYDFQNGERFEYKDVETEAIAKIKALVVESIGEDEQLRTGEQMTELRLNVANGRIKARNKLRAEIRTKWE